MVDASCCVPSLVLAALYSPGEGKNKRCGFVYLWIWFYSNTHFMLIDIVQIAIFFG
jgi:hypothetical protein